MNPFLASCIVTRLAAQAARLQYNTIYAQALRKCAGDVTRAREMTERYFSLWGEEIGENE